ncbi:MAG: ABC-F family ATP-binding cassette domain-containing protein [Bacteroidetes bacterium]|nr:ABC-F family ATP-binding cassette domain-containing protein [Bacteroidota bacterium]
MIGINNISVQYGGESLFNNISFIINDPDRIGLVGKNGAGKSTLLRIIAGLQQPHQGNISKPQGTTTGYLPQEMSTGSDKTVWDETFTAFVEIIDLENNLRQIEKEMSERTDFQTPSYLSLVHRHHELYDRYLLLGGQTLQADTEKVLTGLGFLPQDFQQPMHTFSSGWQMRVEIAKILLRRPDVILFDEPTNHLDIESIQWLEEYLAAYRGAVVLVSHDRAFLDRVTTRTIEITMGKIYDYKTNYSAYVILREERLEQQMARLANQQRQVDQIERFIERFRYKSTKARQVQSRIEMLEKIDMEEPDEIDVSSIYFRFRQAPPSGKIILEVNHAGKNYGEKTVLQHLNFIIARGERIAFVGKNGEGKTTLSKMINGLIPFSGSIRHGHHVNIGYFAQNQSELLDPDKTVFETIDDVATGDDRPQVKNILGSFLFGGDAIDKKVKVLSGGEKARLALARLLLTPANLLVLDEPTNHLDMRSKDILKNALLHYSGTLIIVSHDREFLDDLTNKVFEFRDKGIREYHGGIYDYLHMRKILSLRELEKNNPIRSLKEKEDVSEKKLEYEKRKSAEKEQRKIINRISRCEQEINALEAKIKEMERQLTNPEVSSNILQDRSFYEAYESNKNHLSQLLDEWGNLHEQFEKMRMA